MSDVQLASHRRRRRLAAGILVALAAALAAILLATLPGRDATAPASGLTGGVEEPVARTDDSVPAHDVTMFGASPGEANDETWGLGQAKGEAALVRYTPEAGWSLSSPLLDGEGKPLSGFKLDQPEAFRYPFPSPLAGQMTDDGSGVLAGGVTETSGGKTTTRQVLLVRDPHGSFEETEPLPETGEAALTGAEQLLGRERAPLVAAIEETGEQAGHAGALVVPVDETEPGHENRVLHWNGKKWTSEPIEVPTASKSEFTVLAIAASSPTDAWLLARLASSSYPTGSVALFRREPGSGGEASWQPVTVTPEGGTAGAPGEPLTLAMHAGSLPAEAKPFTVVNGTQSQVLTATAEGVWVDGRRTDLPVTATMFVKAQGEAAAGSVSGSWCNVPEGATSETCAYQLPEALPGSGGRSYAWSGSSSQPAGERVITGFNDGVSLRLEGTEFKRVLALGGSPAPADVGGTFGSAFSNAREGWLGQERLPVHITLDQAAVASRLAAWPVSFSHSLLALAPEPDAAVGAASSEALAVGDQGEVARYEPGKGWVPESLIGPSGKRETPILRAVAWPRPGRAYAVGDEGPTHAAQMWLWRGETKLWEPDPATPANFRGELLGIAFDPEEPARGYAVGQDGVLLSYGKTWTQEPESALPAQVVGASFTSVAFAGSEAIVAYRKLIDVSQEKYEGGLIVNNGHGWEVDTGAATAMGSSVPWAVAGLPDGGAAFTASGNGEGAHVFERQSATAPWQESSTPLPGSDAPGSITLFREGSALRAVTAGTQPDTYRVEDESTPPPGFPPNLERPYPIESQTEKGVLRQTATGWSDEQHEVNDIDEPPGKYTDYDTVYEPDPVAAVLVSESGSEGWAVGGVAAEHTALDTSDVWRYPANGEAPPGVAQASIPVSSSGVTLAVGGNAQCAGPCSDRADAGIGPDVWLTHALAVSARQNPRPSAFLYTGPRVSTGQTAGPATLAFPYQQELERYSELLATSPLPTYAVGSSTDLDATGNEALLQATFGGFPPWREGSEAGCQPTQAGCQADYYALRESGSEPNATGTGTVAVTVRVLMLDTTGQEVVGKEQREWIERQLAEVASSVNEVAIAVGNVDLAARAGVGVSGARLAAEALVKGGALGYFFDAPEENVERAILPGSSVKEYGSGTLGYVSYLAQEQSEFIGDSGFLLAHVSVTVGAKAPFKAASGSISGVHLIPNVGELAIEAKSGTLLRRSQLAQFTALARRPRSGNEAANDSVTPTTGPYIPIPSLCVGTKCAEGLQPEYTFTSSNAETGAFVKSRAEQGEPDAVMYGSNGKPIEDPTGQDGLFCAFNKGTTTVTVTTGGLSASLEVTVQAGSARQPCGTVPDKENQHQQQNSAPAPPAPAPTPAAAAPASTPPVLPVPPPPTAPTPILPHRTPVPPPPFFVTPALSAFVPAFVPPPVPTPARPTPPSGTSAVTSPVEAPEKEEEQEAAPESVSNEAAAYSVTDHEPTPLYILGVVALAAFAGASARRRPGRRRREIKVAPATISSMRAQRRMDDRRRRHRDWR